MQQSNDMAALVARHSPRMLRLAFSYVRNMSDAEDIVQEVFLNCMKARPVFRDEAHEKAWLLRATINRAKNHVKSAWFRLRAPLTEELPYLMPEENTLLQAVLALDEKYRAPIHLHYYEGYTIAEIADILGEKPATVGTWLARGRAILKDRIGGAENV